MTSAPNLILDPVLEAANDDVEHGDAAHRISHISDRNGGRHGRGGWVMMRRLLVGVAVTAGIVTTAVAPGVPSAADVRRADAAAAVAARDWTRKAPRTRPVVIQTCDQGVCLLVSTRVGPCEFRALHRARMLARPQTRPMAGDQSALRRRGCPS